MSRVFFTKADYLPNVVLDLDDFAENPGNSKECLELLIKQKEKFPNFKVNLFSIPFYENKDNTPFFRSIVEKYGDWIQLAIHGWHHETPTECKDWTKEEALDKISKSMWMGKGCFVKGFKAPGWQISRGTYEALDILGFWVADHSVSAYTEPGIPNSERRPVGLRAYTVDHPWMVHGHTWDLNNPDPAYNNGIRQIIEEHGVPWDDKSTFNFISEVV